MICNDLHPYLMAFWQAWQKGYRPPNKITEEDYKYIRDHKDENPALAGFVGFGCSFFGHFFHGIARDKRGCRTEHYAESAIRFCEKKFLTLQNAEFLCMDYREVPIPDGAVVYCDPPYKGTEGYNPLPKFDHDAFWEYMRQLRNRGIKLFISEQVAPDDFTCIWQKEYTGGARHGDGANCHRTEKLFI